ncbi:MAG: hypothetical protein ACR2KX_09665 [Chitinophagaceae bacterium]
MVEKNKKIRLDAAKKTIAKLEGSNYNENIKIIWTDTEFSSGFVRRLEG